MDERSIARWRMHTLRLAGQTYRSAPDVVAGLLAVQAENFPQASWAVGARAAGIAQAKFLQAFDEGEILRTHVLRPTWHFVRPDDIRWLVELTAPRVRRTYSQVQQRLEIGSAMLERSRELLVEGLSGGRSLPRQAIAKLLADGGLPLEGQRLGLVLADAELAALICSGPTTDGSADTYALLDERAPRARRLDPDESLAEIALRYFAGHGPATERDLAYWATLSLTDVRRGIAALGDQLDQLQHGGRTYWFAEPPPDTEEVLEPRAHLLQVLDEYHNGYQDSRYVLDADGLVPRGRGATVGMVLVDTQMVGGMRRALDGSRVTFSVDLLRDLDDEERGALEAAARRYADFLGAEPRVVLRRREPSATDEATARS